MLLEADRQDTSLQVPGGLAEPAGDVRDAERWFEGDLPSGHDTEGQLLAAEQKIADGAGKAFRLAGGPEQSRAQLSRRKLTGRTRTPRIPHRSSAGGRNQARRLYPGPGNGRWRAGPE
jgi:hypothetical protein